MNVGERYSLAWKFPHRIEVIITDLGADRILVGFKYAHTQVTLGVAEDCAGPA